MKKRVELTKNRKLFHHTHFFTESSLRTIEAAMRQVSAKATQMIFTKEDLVENLFLLKVEK
ncbi:hypothetical protein CR203_04985 [Salipaludibacillus neizhouensis]|uniref:Uncharacterized protein n=1 Tax=Salipaludibacillus neizhouensis TaxID=885475 RepID=A0A3A9KE01_9BACI|nr:hypothetical protein [Salipaludibacillus neizhouensis]RKL67863.1 hypothetical protein CR203_04985 [Salipaludibacillus neizhouensis]